MNKGYFHSSGTLPIFMYPNRFHQQDFVFLVDDLPWAITSFTWQLVIKSNKGNNDNLLSLTLGNGLSFPIYETNRLRARFEAAELNSIGSGEYFWLLIKTDTNEPILKGTCSLDFDPEASGTETDVTVGIYNNTIEVQIQSLLTGNSSGSGGVSPIEDYEDFETLGFPSGATAGERFRLVFTNINTIQTIAGVDYFHNQIIELLPNGLWVSYTNNVGASS